LGGGEQGRIRGWCECLGYLVKCLGLIEGIAFTHLIPFPAPYFSHPLAFFLFVGFFGNACYAG